ncbi:hypothetical protein CHS0354_041667 [Potamilus streckersoni]|uniref:Uncharacterized protein n=1 Tax=Potamilus streckersoni TaxID=2493646 RepID=A0AAE0SCW4_9BIVA|nr:hypothetical protein CHS0354_041667 [Potamilus streckersoni]
MNLVGTRITYARMRQELARPENRTNQQTEHIQRLYVFFNRIVTKRRDCFLQPDPVQRKIMSSAIGSCPMERNVFCNRIPTKRRDRILQPDPNQTER